MGKVIGIDLGTGNSCVAIMQHGESKIITNSEGGRTTPSVFAITKQGDRIVGQLAKRQAVTNPNNTIYSIKRLMGHSYNEVKNEKVPYTIKSDSKGQAIISVNNEQMTPQQISAQILKKMKDTAEAYLGEPVTDAVITVPAYFGDDQRTATKDAGRIAGLNVLRIINEPTAAALSYGIDKKKDEKVVVFDFGSGTHDISILEISSGVIQVLSTNGDTHLGGDDIDNIIMDWIVDEFKKSDGIDLSKDTMALQRIKEAAEKAKIDLSGQLSTNINLPFITADANGPKHLSLDISRAKFESMIDEILKRLIDPCKIALKDAKLSIKDIDEVLLVGGSTRIPAVQEAVKKFFDKEPNRSLNPDEVVAKGAAIQGAILSGDSSVKDVLLLDVTPLSLGIETLGGVVTVLIPKNTTIPTRKSEIFSTAADNQTAVTIHILQGERPMVNDNKSLGKFDLQGIPPAPRGMPQIEVAFDIDSNGIIHVSAKDKGTGKQQSIKIDRSGQLSDNDIQKMIKQAEMYSEQDKRKKQLIEEKNKLDSLLFQSQTTLTQNKNKIPVQLYDKLYNTIQDIKKQKDDCKCVQDYTKLIQKLSKSIQQIGQYIYNNQNTQQATSNNDQPKSDGPLDAQFEVID